MNNVTISIIMATYNRSHFIIEMLQSVKNQTFINFECLIIDDGSTDNTEETVLNFIHNDSRFTYHKRPNSYKKGLPGVRNFGLDNCKGDYIVFFDDDDFVHPNILEISLQTLQQEKVSFCKYQKKAFETTKPVFQEISSIKKQLFSIENISDVVTQKIGFASCTVLWDKHCFVKHRFKESLMYAEEWECYIKILSEGFSGLIIDTQLYFNRKHPNSNTGEFYNNNPIRKTSSKDAILLVIQNLKEKGLLTTSLLHYFIQIALDYKEFDLFETILNIARLSFINRIKFQLFYTFLPLRLYLYQIKKKLV